MLNAEHLARYRDLAVLLTRYGMKDFRVNVDPKDALVDPEDETSLEPGVRERAEGFATKLKEMGPTFIKFGQLLSTRPDIVPPEYIEALEKLQDQVEPFPLSDVEATIDSELNVRVSKLFSEFEPKPVAAASLGQVHRATLQDGREVVVKIQRPGIRPVIRQDLEVFRQIAEKLDQHTAVGRKMNLLGAVDQLQQTLIGELDYLQEARNSEILRRNLAEFEGIYIPEVIRDLTTAKVLTTEFVKGRKVSKLNPLALIDHDYASLAVTLTEAYLKQICVDGFWHGDPHPGNIFLHDGQLVLLDFGMVGRLSGELQDQVIKMLLGITTNRGREVAEVCIKMGRVQEGFDHQKFVSDITALISTFIDADVSRHNTGSMIFQVISIANSNELQIPSELTMLGKTLLHLDGITRKLDPHFDAQKVVREYTEQLIIKKVRQKFAPNHYYTALLDLNELAVELPNRMREILDQVAGGKLALRIQMEQADHLLKGMQRIANRIMIGTIIAALLISSALLSAAGRASRSLALTGYVLAAVIGVYVVISIIGQDHKDRQTVRKQSHKG